MKELFEVLREYVATHPKPSSGSGPFLDSFRIRVEKMTAGLTPSQSRELVLLCAELCFDAAMLGKNTSPDDQEFAVALMNITKRMI